MLYILHRIQTVGFSPAGGVAKQPVFAADNEGYYGALRAIIIDAELSVLCVNGEFFPLS